MIYVENEEKLGNDVILMMKVTNIYKHEKTILVLNFQVLIINQSFSGKGTKTNI